MTMKFTLDELRMIYAALVYRYADDPLTARFRDAVIKAGKVKR